MGDFFLIWVSVNVFSQLTWSFSLCHTEVHLNQSSPTSEFPSYGENGNDTSLLVSPLLVAGVVIGLVLFLSCVTIIIGSLRKDGRLRHPHLRRDAVYGKIASYTKTMLNFINMWCYLTAVQEFKVKIILKIGWPVYRQLCSLIASLCWHWIHVGQAL